MVPTKAFELKADCSTADERPSASHIPPVHARPIVAPPIVRTAPLFCTRRRFTSSTLGVIKLPGVAIPPGNLTG